MSQIIDAESSLHVALDGKNSAKRILVQHNDEIIDSDAVQLTKFAIKPRVIEDVMYA